MLSMYEHLLQKINRLDLSGFKPEEVAVIISEHEEKKLLEEVQINTYMKAESAHNALFNGWRLIVEGK